MIGMTFCVMCDGFASYFPERGLKPLSKNKFNVVYFSFSSHIPERGLKKTVRVKTFYPGGFLLDIYISDGN